MFLDTGYLCTFFWYDLALSKHYWSIATFLFSYWSITIASIWWDCILSEGLRMSWEFETFTGYTAAFRSFRLLGFNEKLS